MKVLFLNASDMGGAFRAAYRLHTGLQKIGVNSFELVQSRFSDDPSLFAPTNKVSKAWTMLLMHLDKLPLIFYPDRQRVPLSIGWIPSLIDRKIALLKPDLVHLHWIGRGFVPIKAISQIKQPIVWTLHDMWAFTGGCHYDKECDRYQETCGACPQLGSHNQFDLSRMTHKHKQRSWQGVI